MTRPTIASLQRRWDDPDSTRPLIAEAERLLVEGSVGHTVDLRGAAIGMQRILPDFRLIGGHFSDLDISFGRGALIVRDASVTQLVAEQFRFDRASGFARATLTAARFTNSHLRADIHDVAFHECDFSGSVFAGGLEYGFKRCKFWSCNLSGIAWRKTYLRACHFHECSFSDGRIQASILAGVRVFGPPPPPEFFAQSNVSGVSIISAAEQASGGAA